MPIASFSIRSRVVVAVLSPVFAAGLRAQCEIATLVSPTPFPGKAYGASLAATENELVVGSWKDGVTTYVRSAGPSALDLLDDTWVEQDHLEWISPNDAFGYSVSLLGDILVVGAPGDIWTVPHVHVYRREAGALAGDPADDTWIEQAVLNDDPVYGYSQQFGHRVLATDGQLFVSAIGATPPVTPKDWSFGAVYVFGQDDGGTPGDLADDAWLPADVLLAPPAVWFGEYFGWSLALIGDHLLVGHVGFGFTAATGNVHDYRRDDPGTPADPSDDLWVLHTDLVPQTDSVLDVFGYSLAADGDRLLVAARESAFEFRLDDHGTPADPSDDTWEQMAELLTEPELQADAGVALRGDVALIGNVSGYVLPPAGAAFFRRQADGTWQQVAQLSAPNGSENFGEAVALTKDVAFTGDRGLWYALPPDETKGFVIATALVATPWSYVDSALAGSAGEPVLFGAGALTAGEPLVLTLDKAAPVSSGLLIYGATVVNLPAFGGLLVPSPDRVAAFATDAAGMLALTAEWPAGLPAGFALYVQAWVADAGAPQGWAASNALGLVAP